ncbi:unnamed protein product [Schistosoma margrebowiei]|uniref:Uncharacterized protein n=1 Tax=Schistosoma margrebowiei TaxID=48269 RepID=A0A183MLX1_9TREM|nr:unnamed protein product [Schistosoma margrebowiei]
MSCGWCCEIKACFISSKQAGGLQIPYFRLAKTRCCGLPPTIALPVPPLTILSSSSTGK